MADEFGSNASGLNSPANKAAAVVPNNGADLATTARGLWIGVGGDVTVDLAGSGTNITFKNVPSGSLLPVRARRVYVTGTTATDIVAMW